MIIVFPENRIRNCLLTIRNILPLKSSINNLDPYCINGNFPIQVTSDLKIIFLIYLNVERLFGFTFYVYFHPRDIYLQTHPYVRGRHLVWYRLLWEIL